jgi:hypothetical protein
MNRFLLLLVLHGLTASPALAHRLTVDWQVVDDALVLVGRTDGQPAAGAGVQVRSAAGPALAEGLLDATGTFRWPLKATGDLTVVVNAGLGHRRTLVLSAAELRPAPALAPAAPRASTDTGSTGAHGSSDGSSPLAVRVVAGLTFLLAATAAGMSFSNRRRLARLEQRWNQHESRS